MVRKSAKRNKKVKNQMYEVLTILHSSDFLFLQGTYDLAFTIYLRLKMRPRK
jgi:hypothetical protein